MEIPKNKGSGLYEVYVTGIPANKTEFDLERLFSIGASKPVVQLKPPRVDHTHCYGFVGYVNQEEAQEAINRYDGFGTATSRPTSRNFGRTQQRDHSPGTESQHSGFSDQIHDNPNQARQVVSNSPSISASELCENCQEPGDLQCSQCKAVRYCKRECQMAHWSIHKKVCFQNISPARVDSAVVSVSSTTSNFTARNDTKMLPQNKLLSAAKSDDHKAEKSPAPADDDKAASYQGHSNHGHNEHHAPRNQKHGKQNFRGNFRESPQNHNLPNKNLPNGQDRDIESLQPNMQTPQKIHQVKIPEGTTSDTEELKKRHNRGNNRAPRKNGNFAKTSPSNNAANQQQQHGKFGQQQKKKSDWQKKPHPAAGTYATSATPQQTNMDTLENTMGVGSKVKVEVSNFISPSDFAIQLFDKTANEQLATLQKQLAEFYGSDTNQTKQDGRKGMFVAAVFPDDGQWYRAEILQMRKVPRAQYRVLFIDYGNMSIVDQVFTLEQRFFSTPIMAVNCSLAGVRSTGQVWSKDAAACFAEALGVGQCEATVIQKIPGGLMVDLITESNQLMSSILIDAKVARPNNAQTPHQEAAPNSQQPNEVVSSEDGSTPVVSANIDIKTTKDCKPERVLMAAGLKREALNVGANKVEVVVMEASSMDCITVMTAASIRSAESMTQQLEAKQANYTGEYVPQAIGELVLAKFSGDGCWYRAQVLERLADDKWKVRFIDYGNLESVSQSQMSQAIDPAIQEHPVYGIHCRLHNISNLPDGKMWEPNLLEPEKTLWEANVYDKDGHVHYIELCKAETGESINSELLKPATVLPHQPLLLCKSIPSLNVPTEKCQVLVAVCNTPTDIAVQPITEQAAGVSLQLTTSFKLLELKPGYITKNQGELVAAMYENMWNRAEVLTITANGIICKFIDFGNVEELSPNDIAALPAETGLEKLPALAVQCCLANVDAKAKIKPSGIELYTEMPATLTKREDNMYDIEFYDATEGIPINATLLMTKRVLSDLPSLPPLPLGCTLSKFVLHITSLTEFYVAADPGAMQALIEAITNHDGATCPTVQTPSPDQLVYSLIDNEWYRMVVQQVGEMIKVKSVDYGFDAEITVDNCHEIPQDLMSMPANIYQCSLAGVDQPGTPEQLQILSELLLNQEAKCLVMETIDGIASVMIINTSDESEEPSYINTLFASVPSSEPIPSPTASASSEPIREAPSLALSLPTADLPEESQGAVSYCTNPHRFYVHIARDAAALESMGKELVELGEQLPPSEGFVPMEGQVYLGLNPSDGVWYRCKVMQTDPAHDSYLVQFVDYGDTATITSQNMRAVPSQYATRPIMAYTCSLSGISPKSDGAWCKDSVESFWTITANKVYTIRKQQMDESGVYLIKMDNEETGDLSELLITQGLADRCSAPDHRTTPATNGEALTIEEENRVLKEENRALREENEWLRKEIEQLKLLMEGKN